MQPETDRLPDEWPGIKGWRVTPNEQFETSTKRRGAIADSPIDATQLGRATTGAGH